MWGDPRPSNRMDPFRRNQEERFASGWNRDFHARLDGLALERNAGGFQGGRESSRPFEFSGMLGPTGRHFASREEAPFRFGARDGPLADFRAGDFQARELHARQLAMLEFRGRDAATTEFRGRETHPMDYRGREGPLMNYREGDGAPIDFRNRELTPMEFKDRVPPHMDYRERESLADFRSRDAPPDYRGRGMLDMDFRSKEQPIPDLRGINTSDNDFRNRNHPLPDFRAKDGSHLEFLGNNSSPLDFRGKEGSQMDFRSRDVPHSEFRGPGSSDLDFRGRDPTMFNLQGNERPRTDQDFRDRGVAGAPVDLMERARIPPNQPLIDYMQSQPAVRTPDQELHEGRSDKTVDPVQDRPPLNSEQTDNQGSEGQSLGPPPPDFKNGCAPPTPVPDQEQAAAATVPTRQPPTTGEQNRGPLGRGVKRGVDLDFLGRQDTDYRNMDYRDVDLRFDYSHSKEPVEERPAKEPRQDLQMGKSGRGVAKSSKIGLATAPHARSAKEEHGARPSEEDFDRFAQRVSTVVAAAMDPDTTKVTDVDQDYRPASSGEDSASRYIQVQGVPATATKEEIIEAFSAPDGNSVPDLQLTDYNPGYSHDSVCVEFPLLEQAIGCMEANQGTLVIGGNKVSLTYVPDPTDWFCEKCKVINVYSGGFCFQCNIPRHESEAISRQKSLEWEAQMASQSVKASPRRSSSPSRRERESERRRREKERRRHQVYEDSMVERRNREYDGAQGKRRNQQYEEDWDNGKSKTMMIKHVLCSTTQETVVKAFEPIIHLRPESVRIIQNRFHGKAKTFGFIEMESHAEVLRVINILATMNPPFKIDGKFVTGSVANRKPTGQPRTKKRKQPVWLSPGFATQTAKRSIYIKRKRAGGSRSAGDSDDNDVDDSSFIYDPDTGLYVDPLSGVYYDPDTKEEIPVGEKTDPSKAGEKRKEPQGEKAASSQNTERNRHSSQEETKRRAEFSGTKKTRERAEQRRRERFRSPPLSRYTRDTDRATRRSSSERKDEVLGWRGEKKPPRTGKPTFTEKDDSEDEKPPPTEDPFKKPLLPVMMKKKEASPPPPPAPAPAPAPDPVPVVNPLISLLGEYGGDSDNEEEEEEEQPPPPPRKPQPPPRPPTPPPPPPPPPPKKEECSEDKLTDWTKLACLLCKRQFPTKEGLIRHQQLSELHQQNMAIHRRIKQSEKELEYLEMKEREVKLKEKGSDKRDPTAISPEIKHPKYSKGVLRDPGSTNKSDRVSDSKGRTTLKVTGRKGNSKPGRNQEDMESSDEGDSPTKGAGRGTGTKPYKRLPHETYRDAARKVMFARFKELE